MLLLKKIITIYNDQCQCTKITERKKLFSCKHTKHLTKRYKTTILFIWYRKRGRNIEVFLFVVVVALYQILFVVHLLDKQKCSKVYLDSGMCQVYIISFTYCLVFIKRTLRLIGEDEGHKLIIILDESIINRTFGSPFSDYSLSTFIISKI